MNRRNFVAGSIGSAAAAYSWTTNTSAEPRQVEIPRGDFEMPESPISRFLACTPVTLLDNRPETRTPIWTYTDVAQAFQDIDVYSLELSPQTGAITQALYLERNFFYDIQNDELRAAIGFGPEDWLQVLTAGNDEVTLTMMTLDISLDTLPEIWETAGYERVALADGNDAWTIGGPGEFEFDHPVQSAKYADWNNITITESGVVVFANDTSWLELVHQDNSESMISVPEFAALVSTLPGTTVGCEAWSGQDHQMTRMNGSLMSNPQVPASAVQSLVDLVEASIAESDRIVGPMPEWSYMIMGVLSGIVTVDNETGLNNQGNGICRIHTDNNADAQSIGSVVEHRWRTGNVVDAVTAFDAIAEVADVTAEDAITEIDFSPVHVPIEFAQIQRNSNMWPFLFGDYAAPES